MLLQECLLLSTKCVEITEEVFVRQCVAWFCIWPHIGSTTVLNGFSFLWGLVHGAEAQAEIFWILDPRFLGHIIYIVASKLEFSIINTICIVFLDIMKIAITPWS